MATEPLDPNAKTAAAAPLASPRATQPTDAQPAAAPDAPANDSTSVAENPPTLSTTHPGNLASGVGATFSGRTKIDKLNQAHTQNQIENLYVLDGGELRLEQLSRRNFMELSRDELTRESRTLLTDATFVARCIEILERTRLLLMIGEPELGKSKLALRIIQDLIVRKRGPKAVLINYQLATHVRFSLEDISVNQDLACCALIFKDPFLRGNATLSEHCPLTDTGALQAIARKLTDLDAYILMTSDSSVVPGPWSGTTIEITAPHPTEDERRDIVRSKLIPYRDSKPPLVDDDGIERLISSLVTLPKIDRFARRFFPLMADRSLDLEGALEREARLDTWLLSELPERHPRSWFLCLAVLLACAEKDRDCVSSLFAHRFADRLRRHIQRPQREPASKDWGSFPPADVALLEQAHLVYVPDGRFRDYQFPCLRFDDEIQIARLWQTLLRSAHGLIATLLPMLCEWAGQDDSQQMTTAVACLGRIGELDPIGITQPLINEGMQKGLLDAYRFLGGLFLGVQASESSGYRTATLAYLWDQTRSEDQGSAEGQQSLGYKIWIYLLVLTEIGRVDLNASVDALFAAVGKVLGQKLKGLWDVWSAVSSGVDYGIRIARDEGLGVGTSHERRRLKDHLFEALLTHANIFGPLERETYNAAQFALAGLCFRHNPLAVAGRCLKALRQSSTETCSLIALIWCDEDGVFKKMEEHSMEYDANNNGRTINTDRTLVGMIENDLMIDRFSEFIGLLHRGSTDLPPKIAQWLHAQLLTIVKAWAMGGIKTKRGEVVIEKLLLGLKRHGSPGLWNGVAQMLSMDYDFRRGTPLQALAARVLEVANAPRFPVK